MIIRAWNKVICVTTWSVIVIYLDSFFSQKLAFSFQPTFVSVWLFFSFNTIFYYHFHYSNFSWQLRLAIIYHMSSCWRVKNLQNRWYVILWTARIHCVLFCWIVLCCVSNMHLLHIFPFYHSEILWHFDFLWIV